MKCLLCTQLTCRFIIVGVLANFAMYGMMTALAPLVSSVNHVHIDDRAAVGILQSAFWTASMMSAPFGVTSMIKLMSKRIYYCEYFMWHQCALARCGDRPVDARYRTCVTRFNL